MPTPWGGDGMRWPTLRRVGGGVRTGSSLDDRPRARAPASPVDPIAPGPMTIGDARRGGPGISGAGGGLGDARPASNPDGHDLPPAPAATAPVLGSRGRATDLWGRGGITMGISPRPRQPRSRRGRSRRWSSSAPPAIAPSDRIGPVPTSWPTKIISIPVVGGLHHRCERVAA